MYFTEYLPRLNSISVIIDVPGNFVLTDILKLGLVSPQTVNIQIKNEDSPISISLPIPISKLDIVGIKVANNTLAFSIKLMDIKHETIPFTNQSIDQWSCKDLDRTPQINHRHEFKFVCQNCSSLLIDSLNYNFKDSPSELWYEMMDFWHCHKPENHEEHKKNYKGDLKPDNNTVIVGGYYLLERHNQQVVVQGDS
ncbi:hypothetical protein G210_1548 [Candida maltosa Xu316]|uniref:Ubiquitin-conjugating enzyme E2-binding protein n=1 Tax=Candida maltosa (strain Xu316) TaxID=1245528 RepID=M3HSZ9_CANMX|nr:hypothetical protein G210_1548 [Candida maltosa Xu316]